MMSKKQPGIIDAAYIRTITQAMALHSGGRELVALTRSFLKMLSGLRAPDEWVMEWTGYPNFRWHDGEDGTYSGSKREITATVVEASIAIRGHLSLDRFSGRNDRTNIEHLTCDEAASMLRMLVGMIDRPAARESGQAAKEEGGD